MMTNLCMEIFLWYISKIELKMWYLTFWNSKVIDVWVCVCKILFEIECAAAWLKLEWAGQREWERARDGE